MGTRRLFLAIDTDAALKRELGLCMESLDTVLEGVRWVAPEALHLTLSFLGETPTERFGELHEAIAAGVSGLGPFPCECAALGVFPNPRRPAVLWAGVTAEGALLSTLAERLREALRARAFGGDDRPFAAHITLGRFRRDARVRPAVLEGLLERWSGRRFGGFPADQVTLYASLLTPGGPLYDPLRRWPLGAPQP